MKSWLFRHAQQVNENDPSGGSWKTRKRKLKRTPEKKVTSEAISFQATEETEPPPENDFAVKGQSSVSPLASTPKRGRREARRTRGAQLTSTPVHNSSTDTLPPSGAKQVELEYTELITQLKVFGHIFNDKRSLFM